MHVVELDCLPYATGQADEGMCLLVRLGAYRILLDCGLRDLTPLQFQADWAQDGRQLLNPDWPADLVLCTHAHADHARGLLKLHEAYPELPIYASPVTSHLLPLNWHQHTTIPRFCQPLPWRVPVELDEGLTVELFRVGHLPGAAAFLLTHAPDPLITPPPGQIPPAPVSLLYTGDFFLSHSRLVEGLPLDDMRGLAPDVLIIEGSFGTARHPHRRQQENLLAERLSQALKQGVSVLLPVPVLGLGQELLMLLRSHHYFTGQNIDIWVDGPVAEGCDAYLEILSELPATVRNFAQHQSLFWDQRVRPRVQRLEPAQRSQLGNSACIVLTDEHFNLSDYYSPEGRPWMVLLPRQTSAIAQAGTISPVLIDQVLDTFPEAVQSGHLMIDTYLLAEHSDGPATTQLIHNLRPQHVVFVHGSPSYLTDLTGLEELSNRYHLHCPEVGRWLELPIGEQPLQAPTTEPPGSYEGEVNELESVVSITLPLPLTSDPRWRAFADTGLITAHWQGDELVLRGITPRELLIERGTLPTVDLQRCATCQHYRGQRCWNPNASLYEFKVSPEGYCPVYEPVSGSARDGKPSSEDIEAGDTVGENPLERQR